MPSTLKGRTMDWRSYEETVKDIYATLGKSRGVEIEGWGATCTIEGKSGVSHQIDVLTTFSDGVHKYRTAIECKYWNKKVPKDVIAKLESIIEDSSIDKGVVVSKMGFTDDAKSYAEFRNIGLVELRKPVDKDWEGKIRTINIDMRINMPHVYDFQIVQSPSDTSTERTKLQIQVFTDSAFIESPGTRVMSLQEIIQAEIKDDPSEGEHFIQFATDASLSVPDQQVSVAIEGVRFKLEYHTAKEHFEIRGEDHIYMIMESLFEGRRYNIAPDGTVHPIVS